MKVLDFGLAKLAHALHTEEDFGTSAGNVQATLRFYDFEVQRISQVGIIEGIRSVSATILSATSDGRWIVWYQPDRTESNLMLIQDFG